jgi:predicted transcriptional regulator
MRSFSQLFSFLPTLLEGFLPKLHMTKIASKPSNKSNTTSIKLSEELKKHSATAAKELGMTTHAFMVEAIKRATEQQSLRHSFINDAIESRQATIKTGKVIQPDATFERLRSHIARKKTLKVKRG